MDKNSIIEKLQQLAELEKEISDKQLSKTIATATLQKCPEYCILQAIETELKDLQHRVSTYRESIKDIVWQAAFEEKFADRKPVDGVEIKQFDVVDILDEKKAKAWASINMPNALTLKTSELNKVLKGGLEVDWAKVEPEYRVQLATDLRQYLPKEE